VWEIGAVSRMLDRDRADVAASIDVELSAVVEILRLDDLTRPQLDVQRIGIAEVFDLHGVNERSKNALCTVSPSDSRTTRRYLLSISEIAAQRRIRPSV